MFVQETEYGLSQYKYYTKYGLQQFGQGVQDAIKATQILKPKAGQQQQQQQQSVGGDYSTPLLMVAGLGLAYLLI
jgi:5-enolpyruvylshikimate-3-phosphate synthase